MSKHNKSHYAPLTSSAHDQLKSAIATIHELIKYTVKGKQATKAVLPGNGMFYKALNDQESEFITEVNSNGHVSVKSSEDQYQLTLNQIDPWKLLDLLDVLVNDQATDFIFE